MQYAITGGVPKYMELFQPDEPLIDQIQRVILSKSGFLYEEPDFLLNEEVQAPVNYFSVLKAISDGNHKLSKIGLSIGQDSVAVACIALTRDPEKRRRRVRGSGSACSGS